MVFLVMAVLLLAAVHRQMVSYLRVETACRGQAEQATGCRRALACALTLLETGQPPLEIDETYSCRLVLDDDTYMAIFTRTQADPLVYRVDVRPKQFEYEDDLPEAPESF